MSNVNLNDLAESLSSDKESETSITKADVVESISEPMPPNDALKTIEEVTEVPEEEVEPEIEISADEFTAFGGLQEIEEPEEAEELLEEIEDLEDVVEENPEKEDPLIVFHKVDLKRFALNVLDDEHGINEKSYNILRTFLQSAGFNDIVEAVDIFEGRAIIGEDDAEEMIKEI